MTLALLFDLDGTLIDTADDLAASLNHVRQHLYDLPPLSSIQLRAYASRGAAGLLYAGLNLKPEDAAFEKAREAFLTHYALHLTDHVRFFPGIETLLERLENRGLPWGIVTNKYQRFSAPVLAYLGLDRRAACVVSGDTTAHSKPHPLPLLHAAQTVGVAPQQCWYIGDDHRDIDAARAAGFQYAVAVRWGYLGDKPIETWGADTIIDTPEQLWDLIAAKNQESGIRKII
ncbi:MAG: HAD-IA family hydrolase [Proteobacteria bacterium]|nr:HAD-IA family hydrolase [Pseudomonadota bacterium]MCL2306960.1 HAD-IA family hydrolase [Pseudomonadota bacterium]